MKRLHFLLLLFPLTLSLAHASERALQDDISLALGTSFIALRSDYAVPAGMEVFAYNGSFSWKRHWNSGLFGLNANFSMGNRRTNLTDFTSPSNTNEFTRKNTLCQFEAGAFWLWNVPLNSESWKFRLGPSLAINGLMYPVNRTSSHVLPYYHFNLNTGVRLAVNYTYRDFQLDFETNLPLLVMGHFVRSDDSLDPQLTSAENGRQLLFWLTPNSFGGVWNYVQPQINVTLSYTVAKSKKLKTILFLRYSPQFLFYNFNGDKTLYLNHSISFGCKLIF